MATRRKHLILVAGLAVAMAVRLHAGEPSAAGAPMAVIVHKTSPVDNISLADLRKLLNGVTHVWSDSTPVVLAQQPDTAATQKRMLELILKTTPANYGRQLFRIQFQGGLPPNIRVLNSDANAITFVWNVPGAVSIVDAGAAAASTHVKVLKVDGKLPSEQGYPLQ